MQHSSFYCRAIVFTCHIVSHKSIKEFFLTHTYRYMSDRFFISKLFLNLKIITYNNYLNIFITLSILPMTIAHRCLALVHNFNRI